LTTHAVVNVDAMLTSCHASTFSGPRGRAVAEDRVAKGWGPAGNVTSILAAGDGVTKTSICAANVTSVP
jgi:hypothetical protein